MDSKIGNYSDVIEGYKECGIRFNNELQTESDCFEFQNNRDFAHLSGGRDVMELEAPWVVSVDVRQNWGLFTTYIIYITIIYFSVSKNYCLKIENNLDFKCLNPVIFHTHVFNTRFTNKQR